MNTKGILILVIVLLVGGGIFFFMTQNKESGQKSPLPAETKEMTTTQPPAQSTDLNKPKEIVVKVADFNYDPATITLKKGEEVSIILQNIGVSKHNLTVDELDIQTKTVKGGGQDFVVFTPEKTGEFEMYCGVGDHRDKGLTGKLIVK